MTPGKLLDFLVRDHWLWLLTVSGQSRGSLSSPAVSCSRAAGRRAHVFSQTLSSWRLWTHLPSEPASPHCWAESVPSGVLLVLPEQGTPPLYPPPRFCLDILPCWLHPISSQDFYPSIHFISLYTFQSKGFPGGSDGKESACTDPGSIPGSGRCPGEGNEYQLQYSCLENPIDRRAWWATVQVATKS